MNGSIYYRHNVWWFRSGHNLYKIKDEDAKTLRLVYDEFRGAVAEVTSERDEVLDAPVVTLVSLI